MVFVHQRILFVSYTSMYVQDPVRPITYLLVSLMCVCSELHLCALLVISFLPALGHFIFAEFSRTDTMDGGCKQSCFHLTTVDILSSISHAHRTRILHAHRTRISHAHYISISHAHRTLLIQASCVSYSHRTCSQSSRQFT